MAEQILAIFRSVFVLYYTMFFAVFRTKGIKLSLLGSLRQNVTGVEDVITRKP